MVATPLLLAAVVVVPAISTGACPLVELPPRATARPTWDMGIYREFELCALTTNKTSYGWCGAPYYAVVASFHNDSSHRDALLGILSVAQCHLPARWIPAKVCPQTVLSTPEMCRKQWEFSHHGSLLGHVVPGLAFIVYACWLAVVALPSAPGDDADPRAGVVFLHPVTLFKSPRLQFLAAPAFIITVAVSYIVGILIDVGIVDNVPHITFAALLGFAAAADALTWLQLLPAGAGHLCWAAGFGILARIMYIHSAAKVVMLDTYIHATLGDLFTAGSLIVLVDLYTSRSAKRVPLVDALKALALMLGGVWHVYVARVKFGFLLPPYDIFDRENTGWAMLMLVSFVVAHVAGAAVLTLCCLHR